MAFRDRLDRWFGSGGGDARSDPTLGLDAWLEMFSYAGNTQYAFVPQQTLLGQPSEISQTYAGYVQSAFKANGVVFACMLARLMLFSEARFQFRRMLNGRPQDLFGTGELGILEAPWVNGTTGNLLTRMLQDADLEGNFYAYRDGDTLHRMRPDWVSIALGSNSVPEQPGWGADATIIGYGYHPGGYHSSVKPQVFLPEQVVHFAPIPDPAANFRGMSWLTPVMREVMGDNAMMDHKLKYFEHGATPNMMITVDPSVQAEMFDTFVTKYKEQHEGVANAYKTIFLGGGSTPAVVGGNLQQLDFKVVQGHGETRIAAAAGVPAIVVGLSEGLASATYSNFAQARRAFADRTMRPLWREAAASLASVVNVPPGAELWYDDRDIAFLAEDQADIADIQSTEAATLKSLIDAGFQPESAVEALVANDMSILEHSGLYSVQLQPAGQVKEGLGAVIGGVAVPALDAPKNPQAKQDDAAAVAQAQTKQIPVKTSRDVRALLEPWLPKEEPTL